MSQQIEIEFKNLLTKEEFDRLTSFFHLSENDFVQQENHYFDTELFQLKELGIALRIRAKNNRYVLTLKEPAHVGLLETHQPLSEQEALTAIRTSLLPKEGEVMEKIARLGIKSEMLVLFGSLTTFRAEKVYKNGLIVLDHSRYENKEDFEAEFEAKDEKEGMQMFYSLLKMHGIPLRKTENKIKRLYLAKRSKENWR